MAALFLFVRSESNFITLANGFKPSWNLDDILGNVLDDILINIQLKQQILLRPDGISSESNMEYM